MTNPQTIELTAMNCIVLSLSVPRPDVTKDLLIAVIRAPANAVKAGLMDSLFTEIAPTRIAEAVRDGDLTWGELIAAASNYQLSHTKTALWCAEMAN